MRCRSTTSIAPSHIGSSQPVLRVEFFSIFLEKKPIPGHQLAQIHSGKAQALGGGDNEDIADEPGRSMLLATHERGLYRSASPHLTGCHLDMALKACEDEAVFDTLTR